MRRLILLAPLALVWGLVGVTPEAGAYETYSVSRNATNCRACHGDFRASSYISRTDGQPWPAGGLHNGHRFGMLGGDCNTCHQQSGNFPVILNFSAGGNGLEPIACVGCHGRNEDATGIGDRGAGLRQHHFSAGVSVCADCHADADPAAFTSVAESVPPPYYFTPDANHPNKPTDACDGNGTESFVGAFGLDNDGDNLFDANDSDCVAAPDIALTPTSLDFGVVTIGESSTLTSQVQNLGTADLVVSTAGLCAGTSTEFSFDPLASTTIPPGGSQALSVTYAPVDTGADTGCIEIASNDPDTELVSLPLSGTGEAAPVADVNLDPPSLNFGTVTVGNTATLTSDIQNLGNADLTVDNIAPSAGTSAEFSFTAQATPFVIPPGGSQAVSVTYAPTDVGADTGSLEVSSDDPDEPVVALALAGNGVAPLVCALTVDPPALNFGSIVEGDSSTLSTSVGNAGTADCTVGSLVISGDPEFSLGAGAPGLPFTVTPGGTPVSVPVTYSPPAAGTHTGTLSIGSNDPASPTLVGLTGAATEQLVADINLDPPSLDFLVVTVGDSSTLTSLVQNLGTADLVINAVDLCAGTSTEFSFDPLVPSTIPPGGSATLSVTYTPADAGTDTGCIAIASNDPDEAVVELGLSGSGEVLVPVIALAPPSLDFGVVIVGDTATLTATISNDGTAPLSVDSIAPTPGTSPEFTFIAPATPFDILPGGSQAVDVTYAPVDIGLDTGSLEIVSNDPATPIVELGLSGSGDIINPDIALVPTELAFGNVAIGSPRTLSADIQNLGNGDLSVETIDLCPGTSMEYSFMADMTPFIVPPGGSRSVSVTYDPVDLGDDVGCLVITSNDPDEPFVELGLSGTGVDEPTGVVVNIKVPGAINPGNRGVTPVKFWMDMMDLKITFVECGPAMPDPMAEPERLNMEDFNDDGYMDVVGLFRTEALGIGCGDETLMCQGSLADGRSFTGTSTEFKTVGRSCKPPKEMARRGG